MINIQTVRHGLIVIALVCNDKLEITTSVGLTEWSASKRLIKRLNKINSTGRG